MPTGWTYSKDGQWWQTKGRLLSTDEIASNLVNSPGDLDAYGMTRLERRDVLIDGKPKTLILRSFIGNSYKYREIHVGLETHIYGEWLLVEPIQGVWPKQLNWNKYFEVRLPVIKRGTFQPDGVTLNAEDLRQLQSAIAMPDSESTGLIKRTYTLVLGFFPATPKSGEVVRFLYKCIDLNPTYGDEARSQSDDRNFLVKPETFDRFYFEASLREVSQFWSD